MPKLTLRVAATNAVARLPARPADKEFDFFISYPQRSAMDLAQVIKLRLQQLLEAKVFFDLDQLQTADVGEMEGAVERSCAFVALLTGSRDPDVSDYFASANCVSELRAAINANISVILLLDTSRVNQSGTAISCHRDACPNEEPDTLRDRCFGGASLQAGNNVAIVPWRRAPAFNSLSMRLIVEHAMRFPTNSLRLSCELRERHRKVDPKVPWPLKRPQVAGGHTRFHVFASAFNEGLTAVVDGLHQVVATCPGSHVLHATSDVRQLGACSCFLIYLTTTIWSASAPTTTRRADLSPGSHPNGSQLLEQVLRLRRMRRPPEGNARPEIELGPLAAFLVLLLLRSRFWPLW